jgi:hypothetical protein
MINRCLPNIGFNNKPIRIDGGRALSYNQALAVKSVEPFSYDIFAFSADGKFLITKTSAGLPDVRSITSYLLQRDVHNQDLGEDSERKVEPDGDSLATLLSYTTGKPSARPGRVLTNNGVLTIGNRASGVLTSNSGRAVTITPLPTASSDPTGGAAFTLTRLPNWSGSSKVNASIIGPREKGEAAKIVLDQTARTRNNLNQSEDMDEDRAGVLSLPLVIGPSTASLAQMNQLSLESWSQAALLGDNNTFSERDDL